MKWESAGRNKSAARSKNAVRKSANQGASKAAASKSLANETGAAAAVFGLTATAATSAISLLSAQPGYQAGTVILAVTPTRTGLLVILAVIPAAIPAVILAVAHVLQGTQLAAEVAAAAGVVEELKSRDP